MAAAEERLSDAAREAIDAAERLGICSISCWEVAMLVARGRVDLDRDVRSWTRQALSHPRVAALPLTAEVAVQAALLERDGFASDPADRIIYATAVANGVPLVTRDAAMREFDPGRTIW